MSLTAALLILGCVIGYVGQTFGNKMYSLSYKGKEAFATPVFASVTGAICFLATFLYNGRTYAPGRATVILGILNGVVLFLYNLSAINAARRGPYPFQMIMSTMGNILMPLIFCMLAYGEDIDLTHIMGIAVMLCAFVVFNLGGFKKEGLTKAFLWFTLLLLLMNGTYGILLDAQQRLTEGAQRNEMIMTTFFTSAGLSLVMLLTRREGLKAYRCGGKPWLFMTMSGVCAAVAVNLLMLALREAPVYVVYPLDNGGVLVGNVLLGVIVLHEKLDKHKIAGILLVLIGFVILAQ